MSKKYFDEYKKEIHYHQDYNNTIDFNQGVQHSLNTHLDIINYVEDDIMKMPQNKRREHFFIISCICLFNIEKYLLFEKISKFGNFSNGLNNLSIFFKT